MNNFQKYLDATGEVGFVTRVNEFIIHAEGLPGVIPEELVVFEQGGTGQVMSVTQNTVEILSFTKEPIEAGTRVARSGSFLEIPVGEELVGNIINPFGMSVSGEAVIKQPRETRQIDTSPSGITSRDLIDREFETGVSIVDLLIPLGFGQRELIIGDRKTGKTVFLLHSVISAAKQGNICVYASIGKTQIDIKRIQEAFIAAGVMDKIIMVASNALDAPGTIFATPYSAMTIAEYFRDHGQDTLVVLDDLSTHAKIYREISLLARRFPGRNSYPGDTFYIHSRLLERAGNFKHDGGAKKAVAITCLPVVETLEGDLSGYVQTNIMSMTDGHIYFDSGLYVEGRRPAVNPFLSVTRVGRQTQTNVKRNVSRELLVFLTLFTKMQSYAHFGAELTESAKITIDTGKKIVKLFEQDSDLTIPNNVQIILFCLVWSQMLSPQQFEKLTDLKKKLTKLYQTDPNYKALVDKLITEAKTLNELLGHIHENLDPLLGEKPKPKPAAPVGPNPPTPSPVTQGPATPSATPTPTPAPNTTQTTPVETKAELPEQKTVIPTENKEEDKTETPDKKEDQK